MGPVPLFLLLAVLSRHVPTIRGCNQLTTNDGHVCVCDETYCDTVPTVEGTIGAGEYLYLGTSSSNLGFSKGGGRLSSGDDGGVDVAPAIIDVGDERRQTVLGFGGAMTDSAALNIDRLPEALQATLLESYFGENGSRYSMLRTPIGGCDYSTRFYTYDDDHPDDRNLTYFQLQPEDLDLKIPNILRALELRNGSINIYGSLWTPPLWMKTENVIGALSMLKYEYYQLLADYMVKYVEEYKKRGITFWGITTGNEPIDGFIPPGGETIPAMGWVPYEQMNWLINNLGPTMRNYQGDLKIVIHDDDTLTIPHVCPLMMNNSKAMKYIDGVGVHFYDDAEVSPEILRLAETDKKEIVHMVTEACYFSGGKVWLGSWEPATVYSSSLYRYLHRGYNAWVDWNLVLDMNGGPSFIDNIVHAPIIVSDDAKEFYKNPVYYVMAHFSKYLTPGSVILNSTLSTDEGSCEDNECERITFDYIAFERPDGLKGVIAFNNEDNAAQVQIRDQNVSTDILVLPSKSIYTVLYNP